MRVSGVFQGDAVAALIAGLAAHRVLSSCAGLEGLDLGLGEQGAEHLPVGLPERDRPVEVGGHALEFAEFVQAQAVAGPLPDLGELARGSSR